MKTGLAIIVLLSQVLLFSVSADAQSNKSISIGGHTFTAKLDDNWTANQANVIDYNPKNYFTDSRSRFEMTHPGKWEYESADPAPKSAIDWTGDQAFNAFSYKTKQSPESIAKYGLTKYGFINIRILKLTKDYIEAYSPSPNDTLRHAFLPSEAIDTMFNGKPALLAYDFDKLTQSDTANLVFLLDDNTVALIDVVTQNIGTHARDIIKDLIVE